MSVFCTCHTHLSSTMTGARTERRMEWLYNQMFYFKDVCLPNDCVTCSLDHTAAEKQNKWPSASEKTAASTVRRVTLCKWGEEIYWMVVRRYVCEGGRWVVGIWDLESVCVFGLEVSQFSFPSVRLKWMCCNAPGRRGFRPVNWQSRQRLTREAQ